MPPGGLSVDNDAHKPVIDEVEDGFTLEEMDASGQPKRRIHIIFYSIHSLVPECILAHLLGEAELDASPPNIQAEFLPIDGSEDLQHLLLMLIKRALLVYPFLLS